MPKSTRELTTVYTGLTVEDFERFSSLASAKKMSRSELAREAIKFYLTWQGQSMNWTNAGPIAQLFERMNQSLVDRYPPENSSLGSDCAHESSCQECAELVSWHETGEETEPNPEELSYPPTATSLENALERIQNLTELLSKTTQPDHASDQPDLLSMLDRIEKSVLKLEKNSSLNLSAQQAAPAISTEDLQQFDRRVSQVIARLSSHVEIGNARIENLQDQFHEIEGGFSARLENRIAAIESSLGKISSKLDHQAEAQAMTQADDSNEVAQQLQRLEGRVLSFADILQAVEERLSHSVSKGMERVQRTPAAADRSEIKELLQDSENRIGALIAGTFSKLGGSTSSDWASPQSAELEGLDRDMLQKIAIEVSLLHYVLWRNQGGDRDQLFAVAKSKAAERVRKWLGQVESDPYADLDEQSSSLF
jgi:hypothetical protein